MRSSNMLEFGDDIYYIDLKAFDKATTVVKGGEEKIYKDIEHKTLYDKEGTILSSEVFERTSPRPKETDGAKYDLLKMFIEYIIDYDDSEADETLGLKRALNSTPLGYKIVFNTLLKEGIIKEKE